MAPSCCSEDCWAPVSAAAARSAPPLLQGPAHASEDAVDFFSTDAGAADLPKYVANLNRVERDLLLVAETEIGFSCGSPAVG